MIYELSDLIRPGATFPPASEVKRLDGYRVNEMLLDDDPWAALPYYDKRVKFALSNFQLAQPIAYYYDANYWADLVEKFQEMIYGDPPEFKVEGKEDAVKSLLEATGLQAKIKEGCADFISLGDWVTKIVQTEKGVEFINVNPSTWFPIVSRENVKEIKAHVLAWIVPVGKDKYEFHVQVHEKGKFTNLAFAVDKVEKDAYYIIEATKQRIDCPLYTIGKPLTESKTDFALGMFDNGLSDEFAIIHTANNARTRHICGFSDFDKITEAVMEYNVRMTLKNVVLDKHSAPVMYGPVLRGDGNGDVGNYLEIPQGETPPNYLTWDASMQSVQSTIDKTQEDIANLSGLGSLLNSKTFGESQGYDALMIKLAPALMRTAGKRQVLEPHLKKLISLLSVAFEKIEESEVSVLWHDGIPTTESTRADIAQKHLATGWSIFDVLTKDYGWTEEAAEEAIQRKKDESPQLPVMGYEEPTDEMGGDGL